MKKNKLFILSILGLIALVSCSSGTSTSVNESSTSSENNSLGTSNATSEITSGTNPNTSNYQSSNETSSNNQTSSGNNTTSSQSKPVEVQGEIEVTKTGSSYETIFMEWKELSGATSYNIYYKTTGNGNYIKIDDMLIRKYPTYFRADIVGLKKGNYEVKIVACKDGKELNKTATFAIDVASHIREGYGFVNGSASGAYNDDGTLKSNAVVAYVTSKNAKNVNVTLDGNKYNGLQALLNAKQKTASKTPLCIRIVGTINDTDVDSLGSSSEGLQIKGKSAFSEMNLTIEGIGNDATIKGFGMLIRNCKNVEIRNLGFFNFMDDGVSIDTDNSNLWVHNNDFFYGEDGGGDKAKGDGALDTKQSKNITHSFNHFWDSGKCNLQGMKEETAENTITYHHNWYDHSDSRHPRVRTGTVHIYNNYYDGNSKYGIGATMGASIFAEANFFRSCKKPMLISKQGSDIASDPEGTFSGEDGGMIKAYNNHLEGSYKFTDYSKNSTQFDAYVVSDRNQKVPNTVKAFQGGATYSNFDTNSNMYKYNVETPEQAKATVMNKAGRIEGGDFKWTFTSADDSSYAINPGLRTAVTNYKTTLVSIQGEGSSSGSNTPTPPTPSPTPDVPSEINDEVYHNFTDSETKSDVFTITGNMKSKANTVTYNGLTLTKALKMESATSIKFTINQKMKLTLVFEPSFAKSVKIDGTKVTAVNGIVEKELAAGAHEITKGDSGNLYYIGLAKI